MTWETIRGDWGTHPADLSASRRWFAEWRRRIDAARPLVALDSQTPWAQQREAVLDAWHAAHFTYLAANVPPPSDPAYRATMADWYGYCRTTPAGVLAYEVRALLSPNGGGPKMRNALDPIWRAIKGAPRQYAMPVRASLGSDAAVVSMCLEATGPDDCSYRGLFTGCANVVGGAYRETSCDATYNASTFEWYDGPAGGRCSPPFRLSLDVLADLLAAWTVRGGVPEMIDDARSFAAVTNTANAMRVGLTPATYLDRLLTAETRLNQATRIGGAAKDPIVITGIGVAVAACVAAAGPFAPLCGLGGAVITGLYMLTSVGRIGSLFDSLGMPLAIAGPDHGPLAQGAGPVRVGWLASVLAMPDARGVVPLSVPPVPGHVFAPWEVLGVSGFNIQTTRDALPRSSPERIEASGGGPGIFLVAALIVGGVLLSQGKR